MSFGTFVYFICAIFLAGYAVDKGGTGRLKSETIDFCNEVYGQKSLIWETECHPHNSGGSRWAAGKG